jgi:hypothetical protein
MEIPIISLPIVRIYFHWNKINLIDERIRVDKKEKLDNKPLCLSKG